MDWQPIESAPKDGAVVELGWLPNWPTLEFAVRTKWRHGEWDGHYSGATHWRPVGNSQ